MREDRKVLHPSNSPLLSVLGLTPLVDSSTCSPEGLSDTNRGVG